MNLYCNYFVLLVCSCATHSNINVEWPEKFGASKEIICTIFKDHSKNPLLTRNY